MNETTGNAEPFQPARRDALFVSASAYMKANGPAGGVQICTREYVDSIRLAGFDLREVTYGPDRRLLTRIRRRLGPRPYANMLPPDLPDRIVAAAAGASVVFLNQVDLTPIAAELRRRLPKNCALVLLSHGAESVDYLHLLRSRVSGGTFVGLTARDQRRLGRMLTDECSFRPHLDGVICLAPFEAEIERWLGSRRVTWLPRTIPADHLDWAPVAGRLGFVGTLNHPPNREGLELFLKALATRIDGNSAIRMRLVGGPKSAVEKLTSQYPWVEYLGPMPDEELRREAATWACFCHPLFCHARGCSTKLAVGISWGIPVVTTSAGHRGYEWSQGSLAVAESPDELARLALRTSEPNVCRAWREGVLALGASSPALSEVARRLRGFIDELDVRAIDSEGLPPK